MRFDFTLIPTFLFASAVLADHSREDRSSQSLDVVEKRTSATSDSVSDFGGAVLNVSTIYNVAGAGAWNVYTFNNVTGTIAVPYIGGPNGSAVNIWVGLEGVKQCGAVFVAGLMCTITPSGRKYTAAARFYPNTPYNEVQNFNVTYGDLVKVTVNVSMSFHTEGYATFEITNKNISRTLRFTGPLCQLNARWIVERVEGQALAHFGVVAFVHPAAYRPGNEEFTAGGSSIYDITTGDGKPLTAVDVYDDVILVREKSL